MAPLVRRLVFEAVQQPLWSCLAAFLLLLAVLRSRQVHASVSLALQRHGLAFGASLSALLLAAYGAAVVWYLSLPILAGEVEPMVASVSWLLLKGEPLYRTLDAPQQYSALYGPMLYVVHALFYQLLGPSLFTAKLPGVLAPLLAFAALYAAFAGTVQRRLALVATGFIVLACSIFGYFTYISRSDSLLLFLVSFGLLAAVRFPRLTASLAVGLAMGLSINLKIHSALYFLPLITLLYFRTSLRWLLLCAVIALGLFVGPFTLKSISFAHYLMWLREAARHGLDVAYFMNTLKFAVFFLLPSFVPLIMSSRWREILRRHRDYTASVLASVILVAVVAAKPGAGFPHLLPLLPAAAYLGIIHLDDLQRHGADSMWSLRRVPLAALLTVLLVPAAMALVVQYKSLGKLQQRAERTGGVQADIATILSRYPRQTVGMGYGGEGERYEVTFFRPELAFAGNPVLLDAITLMEGQRSGRPLAQATLKALAEGEIGIWLIPRGAEPFRKKNWYPPRHNLFSQEFLRIFHESYELKDRSRFFDLWFWKRPSQAPPEVIRAFAEPDRRADAAVPGAADG